MRGFRPGQGSGRLVGLVTLGAAFLGRGLPARGADAGPVTCVSVFADDFESGDLARWEGMYGTRPGVTSRGAIAGAFSLLSDFRDPDAVEKFLPSQSTVRLGFTVNLGMSGQSTASPAIAALSARGQNRDLLWVTVASGGSTGFVVSARAFSRTGAVQDAPSFPMQVQARVQVEWEQATGPGDGFVRLFADGQLLWTSPASGDQATFADALYLGNMGTSGSGRLLVDDVLLETCSPAVDQPDALGPPAPDAAAADVVQSAVEAGLSGPDASADRSESDTSLAGDADVDVRLRVGCACSIGRSDGEPNLGPAGPLLAMALLRVQRAVRRRPSWPRSTGRSTR